MISSISYCFSWVTCNIFSHWKSFNQRQLLLYHPTLTTFVRFLHSGLRQSQREDAAASKAEGRRGLPIEAGERNTTSSTKLKKEMFEGHVLQKSRALNSSDEMMCPFWKDPPKKIKIPCLSLVNSNLDLTHYVSPIFLKGIFSQEYLDFPVRKISDSGSSERYDWCASQALGRDAKQWRSASRRWGKEEGGTWRVHFFFEFLFFFLCDPVSS